MPFNYKTEYARYKQYYQSVEPKLQTPENRAYTAIIFSFLAISLFGWYAIRPTIQTIFNLRRQIADDIVVDKKMEDKISALIEAQAAYQEAQTNVPLIDNALPVNPDAVQAYAQLRNLAQSTGVTVVNVSIPTVPIVQEAPLSKSVQPTNKTISFPVSFSVVGPYVNIKEFIQGAISLRRILSIDNMLFTPKKNVPSSASESATPTGNEIQVDLKLKIYYLET